MATSTAWADYQSDLLKRARSGDVSAMRNIGKKLYYGHDGFPKQRNNAIKWWKEAVDKGDASSMLLLGQVYETGKGAEKDVKKAFELYCKASEKGEKKAEARVRALPLSVSHGWWKKKADGGDIDAMVLLADSYYNGKGNFISEEDASDFYVKAAIQGNKAAIKALDIIPWKYREQYLLSVAEKGNTEAMMVLAKAYESGSQGTQDLEKARRYYKKAADRNVEEAIVWIKKSETTQKSEDPVNKSGKVTSQKKGEDQVKSEPTPEELARGEDGIHRPIHGCEPDDEFAARRVEYMRNQLRSIGIVEEDRMSFLYTDCDRDKVFSWDDLREWKTQRLVGLWLVVLQKLDDNLAICYPAPDPRILQSYNGKYFCVEIPHGYEFNFVDRQFLGGIFLRDGEYSYENSGGVRKTIAKYILLVGRNKSEDEGATHPLHRLW